MGAQINARQHVLDMIQKAADKAAEKGVAVKVDYSEFGFDGKIEATVNASASSVERKKAIEECAKMLDICESWTDKNYKDGALAIRDRMRSLLK